MRALLLLLALACTGGPPRESKRKGAESRADARYPAPPVLPDAPVDLWVPSDDDDGTLSGGRFLASGPDETNRAGGGDAIVLRFGPAGVEGLQAARLHLPVVARGGQGPLVVRITGLVDDGSPLTADRARTAATVTWTVPAPWKDPYTGMPDPKGRTPLVCAPFERATPDLAPIVAELRGASLTFLVEAVEGELVIQDSQDVGGTECPGRVTPRLELFPTLRSTFLAKELVGRPLDGTASVSMLSVVEVELSVEYGAADRRETPWVRYPAGVPIEVVLDGLLPATAYTWTARYRRAGSEAFETGPVQRLQTPRATGEPFTFTVTADGHFINMEHRRALSSMHLLKQTMERAGVDRPDFHLDLGDSFNSESYRSYDAPDDEETVRRHLAVRPYFERVGAPLFSILGNHEGEQGWRTDGLPDRAARARKALYPNPRSSPEQDWYAFRWGDVLVVVLDPYRYTLRKPHDMDGDKGSGDRWDWTLGKEQYDWLVRTLAESKAKYELVFSHQVTGGTNEYGRGGRLAALGDGKRDGSYEWGGNDPKGVPAFAERRPGWGRPVHQVLADAGVTAFVHGHDHVFAFETPLDGVGYVTVPQPGDARYEIGHGPRSGIDPDATVVANSGHLRFSTTAEGLKLEYVRSFLPGDGEDGEVAFSHTFTD